MTRPADPGPADPPPAPAPAPDGDTAPVPAPADPGAPVTWSALRPLLLRLHFYAGVLIGPFLLVAALTGLAYTITPQLEPALYAHELSVTPRGDREPLARQVAAAERAVPDGTLVSVTPPPGADDSTRVVFDEPGLREGYTTTAFVDPYDTEVLGTLETFGQWLPVRAWLDELHRTLHLGEFGRHYSELAASWLWVEILAGLALWAGLPRNRRRLRRMLLPRRGAEGRGRTLSWHGAVGLWAAVGLLGLSATGLSWSAYAGTSIGALKDSLDGGTPAVSTAVPRPGGDGADGHGTDGGHGADGDHAEHQGGDGGAGPGAAGDDVGVDAVLAAAHGAGLRGTVVVTPPDGPGSAYVVAENTRSWPERQDSVAVDPATGEVTATLDFDDYPLLAKLTTWGIDAHMGLLFGPPNQIALALLALALTAMVLWGYRMWWLRRPTRAGGASLGRAPARGGWARVPGRVLAPTVVVLAFVGYQLPLFGLPLVAFLAVDLAVGAVRRRGTGVAP
ncbi:PepSY-associated TM helix domain-containing protein [Streptomyces sp. NPDC054784]